MRQGSRANCDQVEVTSGKQSLDLGRKRQEKASISVILTSPVPSTGNMAASHCDGRATQWERPNIQKHQMNSRSSSRVHWWWGCPGHLHTSAQGPLWSLHRFDNSFTKLISRTQEKSYIGAQFISKYTYRENQIESLQKAEERVVGGKGGARSFCALSGYTSPSNTPTWKPSGFFSKSMCGNLIL